MTLFLVVVILAYSAGCGRKAEDNSKEKAQGQKESTVSQPKEVVPANEEKKEDAEKAEDEKKTKSTDEQAAEAAVDYVRANFPNTGELDVLEVRVIDLKWARVTLQPKDKSTDAAAAYLRETNGAWIVFDFGTGITPEQHPEAPGELF